MMEGLESLRYGDHPKQRILLLRSGLQPAPLVVFVHGGGWVAGEPEDGLPILRAVAAAGFDGASVGYRLAPEVKHPDLARDVAAGLGYLLRHLDVNPHHVVASGHSAGAQLLFWLAFERQAAIAAGWNPADLAGLVGLSGVFDVHRAARVAIMRRDWIRPAFGGEENWRAASPLELVRGGLPPVLLLNAEQDWGLHRQGDLLVERLTAAGVLVSRHVIEDRNHMTIVQRFGEPDDPAAALVIGFVQRVSGRG